MKFLKYFLITLLIFLILIVVGVVIFLKTFNVNQYKDNISQKLSEVLHRPVTMGDIKLSISLQKGGQLEIKDLVIDELLQIQRTFLDVNLKAIIFKKELLVNSIECNSAQIKIVKESAQEFNFSSLISPQKVQESQTKPAQEKHNTKSSPDIHIKSIEFVNWTFSYLDKTTDPISSMVLKGDILSITNFSLNDYFEYQLRASLFSKETSFALDGQALLDLHHQKVSLRKLKVSYADLSRLDFNQLIAFNPQLKNVEIENLSGGVNLDVKEFNLINNKPENFSGDLNLSKLFIKTKQMPFLIESLNSHIQISEKDLNIDSLVFSMVKGKVDIKGLVQNYLTVPQYNTKLNLKDLSVFELLKGQNLPLEIQGKLDGDFNLSGVVDPKKDPIDSLIAEGKILVNDGRLVNFNLIKKVLDKMSSFPELSERVKQNLSENYKKRLEDPDTQLEEVAVDLSINKSLINLPRIVINADGFVLEGNGNLDLKQNLKLDSSFYFNKELSNSLVLTQDELRSLFDKEKQIRIPFKTYQGKLDDFKPIPDMGDIIRTGIENRGKEELRKVLFKALDISDEKQNTPDAPGQLNDQAPAQSNVQPNSEPQSKQPSEKEQLIDGIIDALPIFKK